MITTIEPLLIEVSHMLGESTTDSSTSRIGFANRAINYIFQQYAWSFRRKKQTLTTTVNTQEYDLTDSSIITDGDYDPTFGIYQVWNGTAKLSPILFDNVDNYSSNDSYSISPDGKKIIFTSPQTSATNYDLWYYAGYVSVASKTTPLKTSIPETFSIAICTYIRHLIHDRKRQRNDARNMLLDCQEQLSDLRMAQGKSKAQGLKRNIPTPLQYAGFRRSYNY